MQQHKQKAIVLILAIFLLTPSLTFAAPFPFNILASIYDQLRQRALELVGGLEKEAKEEGVPFVPSQPISPPAALPSTSPPASPNRGESQSGQIGAPPTTSDTQSSSQFQISSCPSFDYLFDKFLQLGSQGCDAAELQSALATDASLYPEKAVTGTFDTPTENAVKKFQIRYAIATSGECLTTGFGCVGSKTRAKLNEVFGGGLVASSGSRSFEALDSSSSPYDEIRLYSPYLRDYFSPQVTNLAFHREIKCKHFKEKNCTGVKLNYSGGGSIVSFSFTPSPYTASESIDQQNGVLVWQVPKTTKTYWVNFDSNTMAQEDINGFYQTCPTDITIRCNTKLQNGGYTSISFSHVAGVNETVHLFGIQDDIWNSGVGGYLTGKHSVRFFGDEASFVIPIPTDPFTRTVVSIFLNYFLFSGNTLKSAAHLDGLPYQMPVNASLALDCKMHYFSNATPGSAEASLIDDVKNQWQQALGNMFTFTVSHGSGKTIADVPTSLSEGACNKGNRCGEDGANDIILTNDGTVEFYKNLVQDSGSGDIDDLLKSLFGAESVGAAALWYGFTGSQGNNDVAVILKSMKILIQTFGLNLANADHVKAFKMMLGHELSHALFGRGANDVMYYDDAGNLHIPPEALNIIKGVYKHCVSQSGGGEQPYHPLISVEQ